MSFFLIDFQLLNASDLWHLAMADSVLHAATYTTVFVNSSAIPVTFWWGRVRVDVKVTKLGVARLYSARVSSQ